MHPAVLDAWCTRDGTHVSLKSIVVSRHPYEIEIGRYFCSLLHSEDPANHCVPIYEVLEVPMDDNLAILVMPLLRDATDPFFDMVREVVDYIHQLFEVCFWFPESRHLLSYFWRACASCIGITSLTGAYPSWSNNLSHDLVISDCMQQNMLIDSSMFIDAWHPSEQFMLEDFRRPARHRTCMQLPPQYYYIDFGIFCKYEAPNTNPLQLFE